ncbi:peroxisome proliferator-activated receptor gamma coactivator 1-alpha-like [Sagmatias obliquidens]|uniref:Peroxisome proliferator-activated receptor gamma coactivator 1-alpha-like n=1 Tax=Tursiops truncatus TaxID=9739 RepID=A0A6J3RC02_TURTR|nr:peroxisome proliferator-activated receptor gamma coactivator 1-alpha-like [Lagenorhynchus obliquidens]XP_033712291.1 peroxisome proliferator-activated receptor gamma coactivator 1-alpha-like [Tursiops truncatus]
MSSSIFSFMPNCCLDGKNSPASLLALEGRAVRCAALVGEDQPLCPDLPELDLSELDVNDLDTDSFLGGLKWCSDQSEIISNQYNNEPSNIFEVRTALGEN